MGTAYQVRVDKRLRTVLLNELQPMSSQVRATLQRLALFPEKSAQPLTEGAYRIIANHLKVLFTLNRQKRVVTVYWLGKIT